MSEILFYGEIGWEISARDIAEQVSAADPAEPIVLRVNSGGGSVLDGLAILSALSRHPAGFHARIEGLAASMAAVISIQAEHVSIPADGWMMFHRIRGGGGTAPELVDQARRMEQMEANLVSFLSDRMGEDPESVVAMLDSEIWMSGSQAGESNLVHEVTAAAVMAASLPRSEFGHAPPEAREYLDTKVILDNSQDLDKKRTETINKNEVAILLFPQRKRRN